MSTAGWDWRGAAELGREGETWRDAPSVHSEDEEEALHLANVLSVDRGGNAVLPAKRRGRKAYRTPSPPPKRAAIVDDKDISTPSSNGALKDRIPAGWLPLIGDTPSRKPKGLQQSVSCPGLPPIGTPSPPNSKHAPQPGSPSNRHIRAEDMLPDMSRLEELDDVPFIHAMRQLVVERAGSVKQAYKLMDVGRRGVVDYREFEDALRRLALAKNPLFGGKMSRAGGNDHAEVFRSLDRKGSGELSLQAFLGYSPPGSYGVGKAERTSGKGSPSRKSQKRRGSVRSVASSRCRSVSPVDSENDPDRRLEKLEKAKLRAKLHKKQLREQFRDAGIRFPDVDKRSFIKELGTSNDSEKQLARERSRQIKSAQRMKQLITECSRPREELHDLRKAMQAIVEPVRRAKHDSH
mmetsp:Transcript_38447/g.99325  ORF Transcript_38447/g.99325 Transcript_38447/m.99325 type:complete len:407 (+) Transcript_38447:43-1263(+)